MRLPRLSALACGAAIVAGESHHELTLREALPGGQDVVLMVGLSGGQVREHALSVAGQPEIACRMKAHDLKVEGGRLKGALQVAAGTSVEKVRLDAALDSGGTYSIAFGRRSAAGDVRVQAPKQVGEEWSVWLESIMGPYSPLRLRFEFDRAARTFTALPARGYNKADHTVDATQLGFDGTTLEGEVALTVNCDGWLPPDKQPVPATIRLKVSLDGKGRAGTYSAELGVEKQREGAVAAAAGSLERLRDVAAPVLPPQAPWRVFLVLAEDVRRTEELRYSPLPPADWVQPEFDDRHWPRYQTDLAEYTANGSVRGPTAPAQMCLRSSFGVKDPAKVRGLKLKIEYLGGAVVYVNGREVGRGHMPAGEVLPRTLAEEYPREAYVSEDGATPLPPADRPVPDDPNLAARYARRGRRLTLEVPAAALVAGRNVLAIALHRAPTAGPMAREGWCHVGFRSAMLGSTSGEGLVRYDDALKGTRVWSAEGLEQIAETLSPASVLPRSARHSNRFLPVKGVQCGNPFDPLRPIRMLAPRNGVCSGQVVLADADGLRDVSAALGDLTGPGGAVVPAGAVEVRYAVQHGLVHYCDALAQAPPEGAATVPVWLIARVPRGAAPGWYVGTLGLRANGKAFAAPVHLLVTPVTVPDSRDFTSSVSIAESPESVALEYDVPCWSDEHLGLLGKSLEMMGMVGNDVVHIPVILGRQASFAVDWIPKSDVSGPGPSRRMPLIRWVREDGNLVPEYSRLEKFLDLYATYCAPPRALCLYVWDASSAREMADVYEGRRVSTRQFTPSSPLMVCVWDPATGRTTDTVAPAVIDPGGEEFWKPMFEGVRAIVTRRGWPEDCILAGMGGDMRPSQRTGELLREWAPYVRWNILSHFSGDPRPKDGKLMATGGLGVGLKEWPAGGCLALADLERRVLQPDGFLELPTYRNQIFDDSTPLLFRTFPMCWGGFSRVALDYWPGRGGPKSSSWFSNTNRLTVPGPDGAMLSVRFEMLREGVQDHEVRAALIRAYAELPEDRRAPYRALVGEFQTRFAYGSGYLSQMELAYDWPAYVARLHAAAAELAGAKVDAAWDRPPR